MALLVAAAALAAAPACATRESPSSDNTNGEDQARDRADPDEQPPRPPRGGRDAAALFAPVFEGDPARDIMIDDDGVKTTIHGVTRTPTPDQLPVVEVARLVETGEATLCDVNEPEARAYYGVIPGARALSHPSQFELEELPVDRDAVLIFYCSTPSCGASLRSGTRAILAGYTEVYALRDGIAGWIESGRETERP